MNIIYFSPLSWNELQTNGFRKTSGAMFKALWDSRKTEKILLVQMDRRWSFSVQRKRVDHKVEIIGLPIGLPFERYKSIKFINCSIQSRLLKKAIQLNNSFQDNRIYWFYDWSGIEMVNLLPKGVVIMEITDSIEQFFAMAPKEIKRIKTLQEKVEKDIDIMFTVSKNLKNQSNYRYNKVFNISNGISEEFLQLAGVKQSEPDELSNIPHPRLCIVASKWSMNHRLDHELLIDVLKKLENWYLLLIGCNKIETKGLRKLTDMQKVLLLDMIPQNKIIPFIQHCEICAVPYMKGLALRDPLKIYEYLACGKPVIITVDEVAVQFKPFVRRVSDARDFAKACQKLLDNKNSINFGEARKLLTHLTWDKRVEKCMDIIYKRINETKN